MFNQAGMFGQDFQEKRLPPNEVTVEGFIFGQIPNYGYSRKLLNNSSKAIATDEVQNHRKKQYLYSK